MVLDVKYVWTQEQVNPLCLKHITGASPYINYHILYHNNIEIGNGQYVYALFIIPVIIDTHGHIFELYALVRGM